MGAHGHAFDLKVMMGVEGKLLWVRTLNQKMFQGREAMGMRDIGV